ncbi:MAG: hypothetical protein D6679_10160 [Candidatus Hydrogenedentota bacterium]|nr:MAG: hypothetical protein D6679_10160 [Candidatus Hydrogenedentota bacterium]
MKGYACPYIFQRMIVHWDGTVPMCVNDEYETAVRGNILENSLSEIWTGASFQEARQRHIAGQRDEAYPCCAKCAVNRVGHGRETLAARTVLSAYRLLGRFLRPRVVSALEGNRR